MLLIVDDDKSFGPRLARAMEKRGFLTEVAESVSEAKSIVQRTAPAYAVVDMRLEDGNGLDVIELIRTKRPEARAIILTGYGIVSRILKGVVDMGRKQGMKRGLLRPITLFPFPDEALRAVVQGKQACMVVELSTGQYVEEILAEVIAKNEKLQEVQS